MVIFCSLSIHRNICIAKKTSRELAGTQKIERKIDNDKLC